MSPEDEVPEHVRRALAVKASCTVCRRFRAMTEAMDALGYDVLSGEDRQAVHGVLNGPRRAHEQRLHPVVRAWGLQQVDKRREILARRSD